ncbi:hypothetical protein F7725_022530 [Dissostichus mawsoni]|uniref:Transglutaminase-like domain-containing protein n=1 Tax=Dissostichus mawsoni TaxID=36200 RepID=A0A7J5YY72_DISMA|nr:hypothetical protein F7725_022530 [Dissostichus mawsoni]
MITDVDLRSQENNLAHRTREIDRERLIVRRVLRVFAPKHQLELILHLGEYSLIWILGDHNKYVFSSKDEVVIKLQKGRGAGDKWWFNQQRAQDDILLTLHSPADAIIGQYHLAVLMMSPDGHILEKADKLSFHLLFNPWCKDDVVYLPDESLLQEYVMNEDGIIFMGTWDNINSIPWNYGQFEDYVMDMCFEVLDNSKDALKNSEVDIKQRNDPVYVSRMVTAMVNSNGDRGLLTGRWDESYTDGVAPYRWNGSVPILQQWSNAGARAVKYGQCWVFAAVACTGEFCCGPCPVTAIKEGNLGVKYDAPFVFAEVNADIIYWIVQADGQRQKIRVDQASVGRNISTKSVYGDYRDDVTQQYKYSEGSNKERDVFKKAGRRVTNEITEPGQLKLSIKPSRPVLGTDFDVIVEVKNEGAREAQAQLAMVVMAATYSSLNRGECKRQTISVTVPAHKAHKEVLRLHYDDYVGCVREHHLIRVKALLEAPGENEPIMAMANIPMSMPELLVQVPGKAVVWNQATAFISFTNPLLVPLKSGVFTVEGAGLLSATEISVKGDINPGRKVSVKLLFSPVRTGVRKLLVDFDSDRLKDVKGVATVVVYKRHIRSLN